MQPIFGQGGSEPLDTPIERGPALKALRWAGCRNCLGESCTSFSGSLYLSRGGSFLLSAIGRAITGADFSSTAEVEAYLQGSGITKCQLIAQKVADHVQFMLEEGSAGNQARA